MTIPIYGILGGGALRSTANPYGVRWHGKPTFFADRAREVPDGYRALWHMPGGWLDNEIERQKMAGARLRLDVLSDESDFLDGVAHLQSRGIRQGVYVSARLAPDRPIQPGDETFIREIREARRLGIEEFWYDTGSMDECRAGIAGLRSEVPKRFTIGTEAWGLSDGLPPWPVLAQCKYVAEQWEHAKHITVPDGSEVHVLVRRNTTLTPEQIAHVKARGVTEGVFV